jgi:holin-like protein
MNAVGRRRRIAVSPVGPLSAAGEAGTAVNQGSGVTRAAARVAALGVAAGRLLVQIFLLWLIFRAGEWGVRHAHLPIPGNVLGMLILFVLLAFGLVKEHWIQDGAGLLTKHLAFFFIPIAVGLMEWGALFWREGHWLLLALLLSTLAALLCTGGIVQLLGPRHRERPRWDTPPSSPSPSASLSSSTRSAAKPS